ncbi:MAG: hypothetical protein ACOC0P_02355, partial [Planctomycetota bacterium]
MRSQPSRISSGTVQAAAAAGMLALLASAGTQAVLAQAYDVIDVQMQNTYGINDLGAATGRLTATNTAGIWQNFSTTNLGTLNGGTSFGDKINEFNQVTGASTDGSGNRLGFFWNGSTMIDLGSLIAFGESDGRGLNDNGVVVGGSDALFPIEYRGFVWENGTMTQLPSFGGTFAAAEAINNAGVIAGWSDKTTSTASRRGFTYDRFSGTLTELPTLSGRSVANDINDNGIVVGYSENSNGVTKAVRWENGQIINLGAVAGGEDAFATALNDFGATVGWGYDNSGRFKAAKYEPNGVRLLNDLIDPASGWDLWWGLDINNAGVIVGYGSQNGQSKGFLLRPRDLVLDGPIPGLVNQNNDFLV